MLKSIRLKIIIPSFIAGLIFGILSTYYLLELYSVERSKVAYVLGLEEIENKNFFKAIEFFNTSIGLNYDSYELHLALASSYKMIGARKLALEEFKVALQLNKCKDSVEDRDRKRIIKQIKLLSESVENNNEAAE
jgi:Tfp pilus assembly protein PilF